jgi:hypothetical protein
MKNIGWCGSLNLLCQGRACGVGGGGVLTLVALVDSVRLIERIFETGCSENDQFGGLS